jgi:hypothetical protein
MGSVYVFICASGLQSVSLCCFTHYNSAAVGYLIGLYRHRHVGVVLLFYLRISWTNMSTWFFCFRRYSLNTVRRHACASRYGEVVTVKCCDASMDFVSTGFIYLRFI